MKNKFLLIVLSVCVVLLGLAVGWLAIQSNALVQQGVTNFTSLTLSDDLIVTDDSTLTDDVAIGGDLTVTGSYFPTAVTSATTATLTIAQCGKTFFLNDADGFTLTLPAVSTVTAGCSYRFVVKTAPTTAYIVLTGNSDEDKLAGGINELEVDSGDDGPYDATADTITFVASTAVVGDFVYLVSDGAFFYVSGQANADGGITITDSD